MNHEHSAWHAGWANRWSIGIEICGVPDVRHLDRYKRMGLSVEKVNNKSRKGPREILSLDPRTARHTRALVEHLSKEFQIPIVFAVEAGKWIDDGAYGPAQGFGDWRGVVTHMQVDPGRKWDCPAGWLAQIFPAQEIFKEFK
jgi:hypothetical protein